MHNGAETLALQLSALADQELTEPFEVIVVLNRCTDASAHVARRFADQLHLTIVEANESASAAHARNAGVAASTAAAILFCDADDRVGRTWVKEMCRALVRVDFVGGKVIVDRGGLAQWVYDRFYKMLDGNCLLVHDRRIRYPISASLGCHREAFDSVGGFDESFVGAACEEIDLAIRLLRSGFTVGEAPTAELRYRPRRTFRSLMRQQRGYAEGEARLARREGVPLPRSSSLAELRQTARVVAYLVVRRRQWNPLRITSEILTRHYRHTAALHEPRSTTDTPYEADAGALDFVVPVTTTTIGGRALMARGASARWYATDLIEETTLGIMARLLREGDTVLDIGANIGSFTVCAALCVGDSGSVVAFEPDPRTAQILAKNLKRHNVASWAQITPAAIGNRLGKTSIIQFDNDLVTGQGVAPERFFPGHIAATIEVDIVTLDSMITGPVDLIKIDVEGYELDVLEGAERVLKNSPQAILIVELNPASQRAADHSPEELCGSLMRDGRVAWLVEEERHGGSRQVRRLDEKVCDAAMAEDSSWYANIISGPIGRVQEIEAAIQEALRQVEEPRLRQAPGATPGEVL